MQVASNIAETAHQHSGAAHPQKYEFHPEIVQLARRLGFTLRQNVHSQTHFVGGIQVEFSPANSVKLGSVRIGQQTDDDAAVLTLSSLGWQCGEVTGARMSELRSQIPRRLRGVYEQMLG